MSIQGIAGIKNRALPRAGVREYWELDPESKTLLAYCFEGAAIISRYYRSNDTVQSAIFQDLSIALEPAFAE